MAGEIHIAFGVDRAYLNQVAVVIASILANASRPDDLRFHVLHDEDEDWVSGQIAKWTVPHPRAVRVQNPFDEYRGKPEAFWTTAMLFRILLPVALAQLDRVLYLDAYITVTGDVAELWDTELGEASAAGVVDMGVAIAIGRGEVRKSYDMRDHLRSLGLDPTPFAYVNSGLLLMSLCRLRDRQFVRRALEVDATRRANLLFLDQDIINAVLRGEIAMLDPRWNVHSTVMSRHYARRHHYVLDSLRNDLALQKSQQWAIHYTGPQKPWNSLETWSAETWWRYAGLTGLDWPRPPKAPPLSLGQSIVEGFLDVRGGLSAMHHRLRRARGQKNQPNGQARH